VRVDTGVGEGGEISLFYDPMIAKLVTHAPTREQAVAAQADALDAFAIEGIRHNIPLLSAIMQHDGWRAGRLSTAFLTEAYPGGFHPLRPQGETAVVLAAIAAAIDHVLGERKRRLNGQVAPGVKRERQRVVWLGEDEISAEVTRDGDDIVVRFDDGRSHQVRSAWKPGEPVWAGSLDGAAVAAHVRPVANGFELAHRGVEVKAFVYTRREAQYARLMPAKALSDSGKSVRCPMPGLVVSVAVAPGQEVKAGEALAVVEAMKMENVLRAERDGTVRKIHVRPGDSVAVDAVILEFA
jgi:propionyl-CoA carboxylase alpha chain